jgi:hypothetical protein
MAKLLHIGALALGLIGLAFASLARYMGPEPKLELLSYFALGGGLFELISIARNGMNRSTPTRFSAAMVILVFCIWRGGSPFESPDALRNSGILLIAWILCFLASWRALHRYNPRSRPESLPPRKPPAR